MPVSQGVNQTMAQPFSRDAGQLKRLLQLAGGTLLLLVGLFCAWQTWLIADESRANDRVHAAQTQAVQALSSVLANQRSSVQQAVAGVDAVQWQSDPAAAKAALRAQLPQALAVDVYSGNLDEVLHANYRRFGYGKAAQLMTAQSEGDGAQAQSTMPTSGNDRRLSFVMSVGADGQPTAWVWVELPFAPVVNVFNAVSPAAGRLDLRQGDDRSALSLAAHGAATAAQEPNAKAVPHSAFSVGASLPQAFIVLPRSVPVAALLALFGLGLGITSLWFFARPRAASEVPDGAQEWTASETQQSDEATAAVVTPMPPPAPAAPPPRRGGDLDRTIFRAYDIRGVVGETIDAQVARWLGQAIGGVMREQGLAEIVIGRDGRLSGPELAGALIKGLREAGVDVIDVGAVPTPLVYFAAFHYNTGCGVSVTGSHNPPQYNGFKIVIGGQTLSGDAIGDLYRRISTDELSSDGDGALRNLDVVPDYIERVASDVLAERSLKVVVDCGNGIAGAVAPQALEAIGCEVVPIFCEVDGTFPNHHPDPSDPENLQDLILMVKHAGADLGLAFDGDGDRLGVVTRSGEIIYPDRTLMLFARDVLSRQPGATIIYDVKCTGHLRGQILDAGGSPMMARTGHSLIKARMRETGAELAGEMSGHFFFKERWFGFDDGIYAAARLLEILAGDMDERSPEQIFATCPKGVSTPELKLAMAEGDPCRFMETFRESANFGEATLVTIDGVRADWTDGWGLVRASNTTPSLVLRFDADSEAALERIKQVFREQMLRVEPALELPF